MNFHPIVVHFPIALITLYAVFELIRFNRVTEKPYWFFIKAVLIITGFWGAVAAWLSGPEVEGNRLNEMHELFAILTVSWAFLVAAAYALEWEKPLNPYSNIVFRPFIAVLSALIGLALIAITGGLGGAQVYGTGFDPFMAPIFKLLGVY